MSIFLQWKREFSKNYSGAKITEKYQFTGYMNFQFTIRTRKTLIPQIDTIAVYIKFVVVLLFYINPFVVLSLGRRKYDDGGALLCSVEVNMVTAAAAVTPAAASL